MHVFFVFELGGLLFFKEGEEDKEQGGEEDVRSYGLACIVDRLHITK